ncbi:glycosyltransferase family 2 protein [Hwanghaeella sp.]|uniref:glycosyltransferase family 2 protein n=1 Tax=Hwanghaeella sp. TaxID=2605943 RepID=UPI003CCC357F
MAIAVVIVNFRTPELVNDCLASLAQERDETMPFCAFVGDADSGDGSVERISAFIEEMGYDWAECFAIGVNGGFAYGNNAIVQRCVLPTDEYDFVYFLNPDTYVLPGAIKALVRHLQSSDDCGVAGSKLENPDGSPRSYGFRYPTPWREFFRGARVGLLNRLCSSASVKIDDLNETAPVDWVSGASFMIRRELLEKIGLMDDRFFLYFEETDFMRRTRAVGYSVWHVAESRVVHLAGQSTGVRSGDNATQRLSRYWLESRERYFRKHFGILGAKSATALFLLGDVLYRLYRFLQFKPAINPEYLWRDYVEHACARARIEDSK